VTIQSNFLFSTTDGKASWGDDTDGEFEGAGAITSIQVIMCIYKKKKRVDMVLL